MPRAGRLPIRSRAALRGLHPDLRRHNFKRYALIYRPVPDGIELVGVFHGSRELEAIFARLNERVARERKSE